MHFLMVHAPQRKYHFPCNIREKNFRRKKRNATISQFWGVATLAIFDLSVSLGRQTFSKRSSAVHLFSPLPSHFLRWDAPRSCLKHEANLDMREKKKENKYRQIKTNLACCFLEVWKHVILMLWALFARFTSKVRILKAGRWSRMRI